VCVEYQPAVPLSALTKAAAALTLAGDPDLDAGELSRLRLEDLRCERRVAVRIDGRWRPVTCTCTHFSAHWRVRPCAACLLRLLETELGDEEQQPLFGRWPQKGAPRTRPDTALRADMTALAESLPGAWPALRHADAGRLAWVSDDENARAATRHGIGLALTGQLHLLQLRVLLTASFARGLRFSDAQRLALPAATRLPEGYRLLLRASKGDQSGRGRWLHVYPASRCALCPVCALDEWLWIRRSAALPSGPAPLLLCGIGPVGLRPGRKIDYGTTWMHLKQIREATGVGDFSLHSPRRGFAALALEQGATEHQIQKVLRHQKLDTTRRYLDLGRVGEIPTAVQRLAGAAPSEPPAPAAAEARAARPPHEHSNHRDPAASGCGR
jgi:integrase